MKDFEKKMCQLCEARRGEERVAEAGRSRARRGEARQGEAGRGGAGREKFWINGGFCERKCMILG